MRPVATTRLAAALLAITLVAAACANAPDDAEPRAASPSTIAPFDDDSGGRGGEGSLGIFVTAKSAFDRWTRDGDWEWMNANYDSMVVWSPYWDSRLADYDDVTIYRDAYAIKVDPGKDSRSVDHPEWILRDASGDPVFIPWGCDEGCPQYAGDLGNPEFVDNWIAALRDSVELGYDGLLIDDVNLAWRFSDRRGDTIEPIDPRTGLVLTLDDWQRYMAEFTERVRAEFPRLRIWHNSIWYVDSPAFDNEYVARQIRAADVIQLERGMNDRGLTSGTAKFGMQTFMSFIDRVHEAGASVALLDETATTMQEQWYNIAGALLVNNGSDLVTTEDWDQIAPGNLFSGFLTDLRDALGPRETIDGTIRREFTGGLVLMTEPDSEPVTVTLGGEWLTPEGDTVSSVRLESREAIVLTVLDE
jgi:hypothetical protein